MKKIAFKNIKTAEELITRIGDDGLLSVGSQYKKVSHLLSNTANRFRVALKVDVKINSINSVGYVIDTKYIEVDDEDKLASIFPHEHFHVTSNDVNFNRKIYRFETPEEFMSRVGMIEYYPLSGGQSIVPLKSFSLGVNENIDIKLPEVKLKKETISFKINDNEFPACIDNMTSKLETSIFINLYRELLKGLNKNDSEFLEIKKELDAIEKENNKREYFSKAEKYSMSDSLFNSDVEKFLKNKKISKLFR